MSDWIQTKRQTHQPTDTQKGGRQRERGGGEGRVLRVRGEGGGRGVAQNKTDKRENAKTQLKPRAMGVQ